MSKVKNDVTRQTNGKVSTQQFDQSKAVIKVNYCKCCGRSTNVGFAGAELPSKIFMILQSSGGLVATAVLMAINWYIMPSGAFLYRETTLSWFFILIPSMGLIVALWGLQLMGLMDLWLKMVIGIVFGGSFIFVLMLMFKLLSLLPSIGSVS